MASGPDIEIRTATPDDLNSILAFWGEASTHASATDDLEGLRAVLARDGTWLLIAESDGFIAGTLIAAWDGWRGNLYRLAVRPTVRRRGIALALVLEGERRLKEAGARRITALVERDDEIATGFWQSADYRHDENMARFVRMVNP